MNDYDVALINSSIVDNGSTPIAFVKQGPSTLTLDPRVNIYNGSTTLFASGTNAFNLGGQSTASALFVGMGVSGTGIPAGTTITGIAGNVLTLNNSTTAASAAGNLIFTPPTAATTANGTTTVTEASSAFTPTVGMTVTGPGVAPGTRIQAVSGSPGSYTLTMNNNIPAGTPTLSYGGQSNSYSGGTFVNEGQLTFAAIPTQMIPGDVTINANAVTASSLVETASGQLAPTANVTINGAGTVTMVGSNTLNSLSLNNIAGATTINGSTALTLSASNAITASNNSLSIQPSITGTAALFSSTAPTITVNGTSPAGLPISAPITSAGGAITKAGTGALVCRCRTASPRAST